MSNTVLHIDASARNAGSVSRELTAGVVRHLSPTNVIRRDLTDALPHVTEAWVQANFAPAADRDPAQRELLALSDSLVKELDSADTLVIGFPIYNFAIPASLKAWIDLVARAGQTFQYTAEGPVGLLRDKRAILVVTSGGTEIGSDIDFATGYMRHVLGFIGITDVEIVKAERMAMDPDASRAAANDAVRQLAA